MTIKILRAILPILILCSSMTIALENDEMAPIPTNTEADEGGGGGRGSPAPDKNQYLLATTDEGEPCDPNNPTSCDSPFLECGWNARDMYYKCRFRKQRKKRPHPASRHFKEHKITKKPAPPTRPPSTTTAATTTPQMKTDEDIFNDDSMGPSPEGMEDNLDTISTTGLPVQMNQSTQESHQAKGIKVPSRLSDYYIRNGRQSGLGRLADAELGTYEVPPYEGALTWDGRAESSRECIPKHIMADNLQELRPLGDKKEYIESNKDMFCDFTKFFHCVLLKPDVDYNDLEEPDPTSENQGEGQPVCRCYDSSMPVFDGVCYIPANFGPKSSCGENVTAPYPIQPWKRAPALRPKCTPNSDCKSSPYYFGRRCSCRWNAKWNSKTHACDRGSTLRVPFFLLVSVAMLIYLTATP